MRIVLMGPPGAGKSTLAKKIASSMKIHRIHLQDKLSTMAGEETALGRIVGELITACAPIPEELISTALYTELGNAKNGFILDDYPRDTAQAAQLTAFLDSIGAPLELILEVHADNDDLMERLVGKLNCDACGTQYNLYSNPPMVEGVCDMCGGRIARRPRDYEETVANRLRNCEVSIAEMLNLFKSRQITRQLYGLADDPAVISKALAIIKTMPRIPLQEIKEVETVQSKKIGEKLDQSMTAVVSKRGRKKAAPTPVAKKTSAKTTATQTGAKKAGKTSDSKVATKKAAPKKMTAKKTTPKKTTKKAPVKKAASKKVLAKKKVVTKKAAPKKAAAKKTPVKKAVSKKTLAKKKVTTKKAMPKKTVSKKAPVKKAAPKKVLAKKKVVTKKAAPKKTASKKAPIKKTPVKKAAGKKARR
jgi:adenylate kinase